MGDESLQRASDGEQVLEAILEIDNQVALTGDIDKDSKAIWLHLHKKLVSAHMLTVSEDGKKVYIRWKVQNVKD